MKKIILGFLIISFILFSSFSLFAQLSQKRIVNKYRGIITEENQVLIREYNKVVKLLNTLLDMLIEKELLTDSEIKKLEEVAN